MSALQEHPAGFETREESAAPMPPIQSALSRESSAVSRLRNTIDLRIDRTGTLATISFLVIIAALFLGLWFGRFAKTETVRGIISATGGFSRLDAPQSGVIAKVFVQQGDQVKAGQPIYALRLVEIGSGGETAVAADIRTSAQTRDNLIADAARATAVIDVTREQARVLEVDQAAVLAALNSQEKGIDEALAQAKDKLKRVRDLVQRGYATRDLLDMHERTTFEYDRQLTDVRLKRAEYRRSANEKQREMTVIIADRESQRSAAQNQINTIDGQLGRLKAQSAIEIRAQTAGEVLAITGKVGDSVDAGQLVAAVGDADADPIIVLDAPARATGLIKAGQSVILKYDAFPYKTFGIKHGTVMSISSAAIRSPSSQNDLATDPRPIERQSLYRVEVRPDSFDIEAYGETKRLRIGSTLSADIVVERRRLIDWVLDPIRAMRGRV